MEKTFCLGLLIGALGGALLVANNYKARSLVKKSQTELMQKVNEMMDEKLNATGGTDESASQSQNS
jgi:hypothetical protein